MKISKEKFAQLWAIFAYQKYDEIISGKISNISWNFVKNWHEINKYPTAEDYALEDEAFRKFWEAYDADGNDSQPSHIEIETKEFGKLVMNAFAYAKFKNKLKDL